MRKIPIRNKSLLAEGMDLDAEAEGQTLSVIVKGMPEGDIPWNYEIPEEFGEPEIAYILLKVVPIFPEDRLKVEAKTRAIELDLYTGEYKRDFQIPFIYR